MKIFIPVLFLFITINIFGQSKVTPHKNNERMWGFIDEKGIAIIKHKYNWIDTISHYSLYRVFLGETDSNGKPILGKGKYGFINNHGKEISSCVYDWAISSGMNLHNVFKGKTSYDEKTNTYNDDGKWGFINSKGEEIFPLIKCDDIDHMVDGYAKIYNKNLQGLINVKGEEIIPCSYDNIITKKWSKIVRVYQGKKQGLYNTEGNILVPAIYDSIGYFHPHGYTKVMQNKKWGLIDSAGNLVFQFLSLASESFLDSP